VRRQTTGSHTVHGSSSWCVAKCLPIITPIGAMIQPFAAPLFRNRHANRTYPQAA
jgi:hypothetical protein